MLRKEDKKNFVSNYGRKLPPFPTLFLEAYTDDIQCYLGFKFKLMLTRYREGYGEWYFLNTEWLKYGRRILQDLERGRLKIPSLQRELEQLAGPAIRYLLKHKKNLPQYNREALLRILKRYCYLQRQVVALGDSVPYVSQEPAAQKLEGLIFKVIKKRYLAAELTAKLIQFDQLSFAGQEELELLRIAQRGDRPALRWHAQKWRHLAFDYVGPLTLYQDFYRRYQAWRRQDLAAKIAYSQNLAKIVQKEKAEIIKKYRLTPRISHLAQLMQAAAFLYDLRKSYLTKMTYELWFVLARVASVCRIKQKWLRWVTEEELYLILEGKMTLNEQMIRARERDSLIVGREGRSYYAPAEEKKRYCRQLAVTRNRLDINEFKGQPACGGKITGTVCRIIGPAHLNKMKKGAILVAPQTTVDYLSAIRQAAAIITDQGGITSHAAVVSRELKIPCVVGSQIATRVLEDGDWVEVDAGKGVVKIFRK